MGKRTSRSIGVKQFNPARSPANRQAALNELADLVENDVSPLGGLGPLRRLAERGEELSETIRTAVGLTWALDGDLWDLERTLLQLGDTEDVLVELANLTDLADRLEDVGALVRALRRGADDLRDLAEEHESDALELEQCCT